MAKYIMLCEDDGTLYVVEDEATTSAEEWELDQEGNLYYLGGEQPNV